MRARVLVLPILGLRRPDVLYDQVLHRRQQHRRAASHEVLRTLRTFLSRFLVSLLSQLLTYNATQRNATQRNATPRKQL